MSGQTCGIAPIVVLTATVFRCLAAAAAPKSIILRKWKELTATLNWFRIAILIMLSTFLTQKGTS